MRKIRVLVVDDAIVVRRIVTDALSEDSAVEVVGTAANGIAGLAQLEKLKPDLVTLDVEMPEMDGLGMLRALRQAHPRLPVIMFSTLTERGAATTLDALAAGASDYVTKPANVGSVALAIQRVRDDLLPKIKTLCGGVLSGVASPRQPPSTGVPPTRRPGARGPIDVVAIGISTGGPNALNELLPRLPAYFPVPIVIVQHMPPLFTKLLAERLATRCTIPVAEARQGEPVSAPGILIAPGDHHMEVARAGTQLTVKLHQGPPENSCRPAVDPLFRSIATTFGSRALAVVMTGMGQDGLRGCESVRQAGGQILAQDEASSVVWGMPGFVARAGLADRVLPLDALAAEITSIARVGRPATPQRAAGA